MMTPSQLEHIKAYIKEFDKSNPPIQYVPQRDSEDYVYIFGVRSGVVLIPENDGEITYTILSENDDRYFITDNPLHIHNAWLIDLSHCLNIATCYLDLNASKSKDNELLFGYKLPYKNKEDEITEIFALPEFILYHEKWKELIFNN